MAASPAFAAALRCVGCGACDAACTPLPLAASQAGTQTSGPIGLVFKAWRDGLEASAADQAACLMCGDCGAVCPVAIPIPDLILELRRRTAPARVRPNAAPDPLGALRRLSARAHRKGVAEPQATLASALIQTGIAGPAERPFRLTLSEREREGAVLRARTQSHVESAGGRFRSALVSGCVAEQIVPDVATATLRALQAEGYEVVYPPAQTCCGQAGFLRGDFDGARAQARQTIDALTGARVDRLVFVAPSCAAMVRQRYATLLAGDTARLRSASALAARTATLMELVAAAHRRDGGARLLPTGTLLHRACSPGHGCSSFGSGVDNGGWYSRFDAGTRTARLLRL